MGAVRDAGAVLRVERGRPTDEELAAVALTLMSLLGERDRDTPPETGRTTAGWRHAAYQPPHSWR
ncbi:acyl-CoA carboxylase subunit epsilon [Streptomyces sp. WAC05374]|uniref:acyl-CoA carboxylase subunit epsilon n=1 Tax=unclassified Streptomyces TaxID=2593676 RepID=UPI000F862F63|nr:acyl-CoA carboxylase subunit epsilon [Streptomyces sp. WAC05374]RST16671.1 acyl-CoA carboxylase subunit epsilon [Streptomyces sp. WAC05374]TDF35998.1 acyl-CoA carboxylase subunit epsilon [Streptomyces sp. WAC05374]TDF44561.1 acyl-CoA carboxylase subunit epsilon [Streptomyces sp. WAC05374]TDF45691.1 acyl-CoA carboxylase subunit epsilon [Streptomyces sp. WAC05374]